MRLRVVILLALLAAPLSAQRGWTIGEAPQADLWYHGLAVVGLRGFGPLPLYDPGYGARIRHVKDSLGLVTALDRQVDRFRAAFLEDSSFEVLHFVPLYFPAADRAELLAALRTVSLQRSGVPRLANPQTRFGAAAIATVLRTPAERRILGEFVDALESEWRQFYGPYWPGEAARRADRIARLQAAWNARLAPGLGPFLAELHLDGGQIIVSPAIGADGRMFEGDPRDRSDNIVAVSLPDSGDPDAPLYAVVRELCYPAVRRTLPDPPASNPVTAELVSSDAATRCGARLLETRVPTEAAGYRRVFGTPR